MKKDHRRKSLAAVGAVVAAGLAPGLVASTPAPHPAGTEATAADVVAINGEALDFDELFAATQPRTVYGPPPIEVRQQVDLAPIIAADKAEAIDFVLHELINICDDKIGTSDLVITPESQLIRDLGMDSLDVVEFVMLVEKRYGVTIPDDFLAAPPTLRSLAEQIVKVAAKAKR